MDCKLFTIAAGSRQIPRDRVIDRLLHRVAPGGVERIAARHHHRAADQIERHKQPPERQIFRQHRRDLPIDVVIFQRHVGEFRPIDQGREHRFQLVPRLSLQR